MHSMSISTFSKIFLFFLLSFSFQVFFVSDISAAISNGTISGAVWTTGKTGGALSFNGTSDYVHVGGFYNGVKSIEFWVNPDSVTNRTDYPVDLNGSAYIVITNGAISVVGFTSPIYYVNGVATASPVVVANKWQHIVVTAVTGIDASDLDIGRLEGTGFFGGQLDEVKFYNRALSAVEVSYHYGQWKVVRQGLVSYWPFDSGSGQIAYDLEGRNNGTLQNMDSPPTANSGWTTGKHDGALNFDGINDYVSVSDSASLDITSAITIEAWVKPTIIDNHGILMKGALTDSQGVYNLVIGPPITNNNVIFRLNGGTTDGSGQSSSITDMSTRLNVWTHIVGTYDGIRQKVYINGILEGNQPYSSSISTNNNPLYIGVYYSALYTFNGSIDEVRIYNRALSAGEVLNNYYSGLSAHFK